MNLADVFTFLFVILGLVIVFVSYWLMTAALFPDFVARSAGHLGRAPIKMAMLGLVTLGPLLLLGGQLSKLAPNGGLKLLGVAIMLVAVLAALLGSSGLALRIGEGLKAACDETDPWRRTLRGGIVLGLTFVLPLVGTFLIMPFALVAGFGTFLSSFFRKRPMLTIVPPAFAEQPVAANAP